MVDSPEFSGIIDLLEEERQDIENFKQFKNEYEEGGHVTEEE